MISLPILAVAQLAQHAFKVDSFRNEMMLGELNGSFIHSLQERSMLPITPIRLDDLLLVLIEKGSAEILVDSTPFNLSSPSVVILLPSHVTQIVSVTPDCEGLVLVVSKAFLDRFSRPTVGKGSVASYLEVRKHPVLSIDQPELEALRTGFDRVRERILVKAHYYQREALQNALVSLLLDLANIFLHHGGQLSASQLTRGEELMERFLELLHTHFREEHGVAFYADALSISAQYLSMILRNQTGKSANKWIVEILLGEAKMLLKNPQFSIQQIAEQLHFSDQSTFGKFFKKHVGQSPLEFRRSS